MKHILLIIALLLLPLSLFSQGDSIFFSNAIKINFKKYKKDSALAYRKGDTERGKFLFDSLVDHRLAGTTFDDYTFKKYGGGKIRLSSVEKPIVLITYASWCVPAPGEIPAINKLAQQYGKDVKFIVLFWNRRQDMRKAARKFNGRITVCYAHESYKNDAPIVASMKHTLGFPTSFYLDENLKVIDIRRDSKCLAPKKSNYNKGYAMNYDSVREGLSQLLIDRQVAKEHLAGN
ncbi:thiol-disulfide oxidoreductase [Flavobacterium album]|uniref:Thiol-disulfide oxidoreductase n=1 Tax=Flavobacterium album TaxID=2175091 RepID=A0A2S1QY89_9FLAO|nr:redoxin domain-containing protein [Flavobacterium album]AWH85352.1 thiol-disulfide oxidoreductase [Flavobacterium album]